MANKTRVRFAPSPTGFLHLGGMRSALFNWLFARKTGGDYLLRIEDTDRERLVPEAVDQIKDSHQWLGLTPDETAVQSQRIEVYQKHADELVEKGDLYPCWCSPERLGELRQQAQKKHQPFKYDRYCLKHPGDPQQPHVLRFKIPEQPTEISWLDAVRGDLSFRASDQDDFVAIKSDGFPTYNFANVVDDHAMKITHVMRAEEFVPSTPKHLLLYTAFGWEPPVFAHLPQVLGSDGKSKLSKRHGAKSVLEYRDEGYLPEAVINFMALLGWNPGEGETKEIYSANELIKAFSLERIQKSPAVFDPERLNWLNGVYIRSLPLKDLQQRCQDFWPPEAKNYDNGYKQKVLGLLQERLKFLAELPELSDFFFTDPKLDANSLSKDSGKLLTAALKALADSDFSEQDLEAKLRELSGQLGVKPGQLFGVVRLAVTGKTASPGLFETLAVLSRETVIRRLEAALKVVSV